MKKILTLSFLFLTIFTACSITDQHEREQELAALNTKKSSFEDMLIGIDCVNAADWSFVPYGSKACGGSQGFVAYPSSIDVAAFLALVADYTASEQAYNEHWNITSDCSVPQAPTSVDCVDNEPVFVY